MSSLQTSTAQGILKPGAQVVHWACPTVCTLWPGDGGPYRHRKQRHCTHNLGKIKPNFHHHTYSSTIFLKGTAASHALFGLLCPVKKRMIRCCFRSSLIHRVVCFFKLERTVLITLHVIHMHSIHEAMKTHILVSTSSSSGTAHFWREVPRFQVTVDLCWIVNSLDGHPLSLLKIKFLAFTWVV